MRLRDEERTFSLRKKTERALSRLGEYPSIWPAPDRVPRSFLLWGDRKTVSFLFPRDGENGVDCGRSARITTTGRAAATVARIIANRYTAHVFLDRRINRE